MDWRAHRHAPAPGTVLSAVGEIPTGACREVRYGEGDGCLSFLLYRGDKGVRVYVNQCPHFSLPLNSRPDRFLLLPAARIMCAYHCAIFQLDDGRCIAGPAEGMGLERVPFDVVDDLVYLGVPSL